MLRVRAATVVLTAAGLLGACNAGGRVGGGKGSGPAVKLDPAAVQARAKTPPPPSATTQSTLGKGNFSVKTSNAVGDIDRYWVQELDIDGDGAVEQTEFIFDDEDRVFYAHAETDVPCADGGTAVVAVFVCVNAEGNRRERPAGSGFYAVYLDAGECGAGAAGVYGCTFNHRGKMVHCGSAVIDDSWDLLRVAGAPEPETIKKKKK